MTRKKFRLKTKPVKPLLKNYRGRPHSVEMASEYETIDPNELVVRLEEARAIDPKARLELEMDSSHCYYESDSTTAKLMLNWRSPAKDELAKAMVKYEATLKIYEKWRGDNKVAIETELKHRKVEARRAALREAAKLEKKALKLRSGV
jgi:hypothetical protein